MWPPRAAMHRHASTPPSTVHTTGKTLRAVKGTLYERMLKRPSSRAREKKYGHLPRPPPPITHTFSKWPLLAYFKKV